MHEIGIVNGILKTVIDTAREAGASRVVSVKLRIGDMCEVVPESLDFAWEVFRRMTRSQVNLSSRWRMSIPAAAASRAVMSLTTTGSTCAALHVGAADAPVAGTGARHRVNGSRNRRRFPIGDVVVLEIVWEKRG